MPRFKLEKIVNVALEKSSTVVLQAVNWERKLDLERKRY